MSNEPTDLNDLVGEGEEQSIQDIWRNLSIHEDLILIIDKVEEQRLRKQLSSLKAKEAQKFKAADVPIEQKTLEFIVHEDKSLPPDQIKLQVFLKSKPSIKVHKIILPDKEL